jgi:hypothetical protein
MPAQAGIQQTARYCSAGIPALAGTSGLVCYAASAFFSGAVIAPDALISPISCFE